MCRSTLYRLILTVPRLWYMLHRWNLNALEHFNIIYTFKLPECSFCSIGYHSVLNLNIHFTPNLRDIRKTEFCSLKHNSVCISPPVILEYSAFSPSGVYVFRKILRINSSHSRRFDSSHAYDSALPPHPRKYSIILYKVKCCRFRYVFRDFGLR
jgi:hypothetical protein